MRGFGARSISREIDLVMWQLEPMMLRALCNAIGRSYARKSMYLVLPFGPRGKFKAVLLGKEAVNMYVVGNTASLWAK